MKKILTSSITDSAQLPLLKRTIDHLQDQELENIKSCVYASLGSSSDSVPIVLWGCVGTILTDTLTVTAGAFIYNGEIYQISAQSITKTGANVFTLSLDTTTFQAGEPTIYSDGVTSVNTNQNLKIKLSQGLTGTGICDWDNRLFVKSNGNETAISNPITASFTTHLGITLNTFNISWQKIGDSITINGKIDLNRNAVSFSQIEIALQNKAKIKNGNTTNLIYANCNISSDNGFVTNDNGGAFDNKLTFLSFNPINTGTYVTIYFNLTYKAENLL